MDAREMQEILTDCVPRALMHRVWSTITILPAAVLSTALCVLVPERAFGACDDEASANAMLFSVVIYRGTSDVSVLKDLSLDKALSCVVTTRSVHGSDAAIRWDDNVPYIETSIDPHDKALLYWPKRAELIARYTEQHRKTHPKLAECVAVGTLKIWQAEVVHLTLVAPKGGDLSKLKFQSDDADYVAPDTDNCDADPVGYHPAGQVVEFKINPQQKGCIALLKGTIDEVAWIPTQDLLQSQTVPLANYLLSNCHSKMTSDSFAVRSLGITTRNDKAALGQLSDLKDVMLRIDVAPTAAQSGH